MHSRIAAARRRLHQESLRESARRIAGLIGPLEGVEEIPALAQKVRGPKYEAQELAQQEAVSNLIAVTARVLSHVPADALFAAVETVREELLRESAEDLPQPETEPEGDPESTPEPEGDPDPDAVITEPTEDDGDGEPNEGVEVPADGTEHELDTTGDGGPEATETVTPEPEDPGKVAVADIEAKAETPAPQPHGKKKRR